MSIIYTFLKALELLIFVIVGIGLMMWGSFGMVVGTIKSKVIGLVAFIVGFAILFLTGIFFLS